MEMPFPFVVPVPNDNLLVGTGTTNERDLSVIVSGATFFRTI